MYRKTRNRTSTEALVERPQIQERQLVVCRRGGGRRRRGDWLRG